MHQVVTRNVRMQQAVLFSGTEMSRLGLGCSSMSLAREAGACCRPLPTADLIGSESIHMFLNQHVCLDLSFNISIASFA